MNIAEMIADAKNKDLLACPYCSVYSLFTFNEPRRIARTDIREAVCPCCGGAVVQLRNLNPTLTPKPLGGYESKENPEKWAVVWPRQRLICSDQKIPMEIRNDMNNAYSIVDISPDAAAGLVRRALERILKKYLSLNGKDLEELIKASKDKVHPRIFELLDSVRGYGNFGAHLKEDAVCGETLEVQDEEASFILNAVKELIDDEFVNKAR